MGKKLPSHVLRYTVLKSFNEGPSYGYEIVSRIERVTEGYWSPSYGTIYPLIQRLEEKGLIRSLDTEELEKRDIEEGDRKYFELTRKGKDEIELDEDIEHQERFRDLIIGYLKVYENKYGREAMKELLDEAK